jgi:hypothetical protein
MEPGEYTATFAKFIISCRAEYDELCERIDRGEVPAGHGLIVRLEIPPEDVDRIRFERIAALNGGLDGGIGSG